MAQMRAQEAQHNKSLGLTPFFQHSPVLPVSDPKEMPREQPLRLDMHPKRLVVQMLKLSNAMSHNHIGGAGVVGGGGDRVSYDAHGHCVRHVMQFQRKNWSDEPLED
eukprot:3366144-Karenia_brevis.AAC.1